MEQDIPFGNSNRENGTTFLDFPLFLGIFQWDEPTKRVPFTGEPVNGLNGKRPRLQYIGLSSLYNGTSPNQTKSLGWGGAIVERKGWAQRDPLYS